MRCLITGINGFVGQHLKELLIREGHSVFGIDKGSKSTTDGANVIKADLLDKEEVRKAVDGIKPDRIFHLAGFSSVKESFDKPELCFRINVDGTENLLKSVIGCKIKPKILIVSSAEIYGVPKSFPIKETDDIIPISPYGESRKAQEKLCLEYQKKYDMRIIISRSFPHIGPGQQPVFVVSDFSKQIAEIESGLKEGTLKVGNLEAKRDFTDVRDMVSAYLLAIEKCEPGEIYNICSGSSYSIRYILDTLISFSKSSIRLEIDPNKMRKADIPLLLGDNSKFRRQTGWTPKISIDETLKDSLNYWRGEIEKTHRG